MTTKLTETANAFLKELGDFDCALSCRDRIWNVLFPDRNGGWNHLHVIQYQETFYVSHVDDRDGQSDGLEVAHKGIVKAVSPSGGSSRCLGDDDRVACKWDGLISSARRWLEAARRDWMAANKRVQSEYPLNRRYGIAPNALIRASLPDVYRLDRELGKARARKLVRLVEDGFFMRAENTVVASMTAADYFNCCRIAYIAGRRKDEEIDESLSGREMYKRYADGRHEGLLDIDETSPQEFADWIDGTHPKKGMGGHPWEIKRGGNTTHIDLYVMRPSSHVKEGFKVELYGESIGRMVETMRMFLAIHEAGLPISIANPEGVRKRLLAQDNIGIVPCTSSLHRANQHFMREDDVFDVMYYDDLGRSKRRVTPFITWEPLPILKPRD